jgi:hypothetical protein
MTEIGFNQKPISIFEDNDACIILANDPQSTVKSRHIQVRFHWIREQLTNGVAKLEPIDTKDQLADLMTKGLYGPALKSACLRLCLLPSLSSQGEN